MKKHIKLLGILAGFAAFGVSAQAADSALVDTLVKKGFISSAEAAEISKDSGDLALAVKGKQVQKLTLQGRLQFQYDYLTADDNQNGDIQDRSQFYFRRVFLGATANLANDWVGEFVMDFADQDADIDHAFIAYTGFDNATVKFGTDKVPFGVEETTSSAALKSIERSASTRFWSDQIDFGARHAGIHVNGDYEGFSYAVALVNGVQGEGDRFADEEVDSFGAFGRLEYLFTHDEGTLLIGVDAGYQSADDTGSEALSSVLSTGERVYGKSVTAYAAHAKLNIEGFELLGEYITAQISEEIASGVKDQDPDTYFIQASYLFDNIEPVVRYSHVDSDYNSAVTGSSSVDVNELVRRAPDETITADELDSWYFGLTYYLMGNDLKFQGGYEWAQADQYNGNGEFEISGVRGRIQLLF